jgi:hypothetical protein
VTTQTGTHHLFASTDSNVKIQLRDTGGHETVFYNLDNPGDDFEAGQLDTFVIHVQGITPPLQSVTIRKDDAGRHPDWQLNYVEVIYTLMMMTSSTTMMMMSDDDDDV